MDHIVSRLLFFRKYVVASLDTSDNKLTMISKCGYDGSSNHTQYKQKCLSEINDDKYMFSIFSGTFPVTIPKISK